MLAESSEDRGTISGKLCVGDLVRLLELYFNCREIQRISGCRVDVERDAHGSAIERKITLKGTSQQLSAAKKMIEEKVEDAESVRERMVSSRQPRVRTQQPLFLSYQDDATEEASVGDSGKKLQTTPALHKDILITGTMSL